jgi:hypothetical protein
MHCRSELSGVSQSPFEVREFLVSEGEVLGAPNDQSGFIGDSLQFARK